MKEIHKLYKVDNFILTKEFIQKSHIYTYRSYDIVRTFKFWRLWEGCWLHHYSEKKVRFTKKIFIGSLLIGWGGGGLRYISKLAVNWDES